MFDEQEALSLIDELKQFDDVYADEEAFDPGIHITIGADKMTAFVHLVQPEGEPAYTINDVLRSLREKDVKHGLKDDALARLCEENGLKKRSSALVAEGTPKVEGKNAWIEYMFDHSEAEDASDEAAREIKVDFKEVKKLPQVKEGDILAVKHPSVPGRHGMNVLGEKLYAQMGEDVAFFAGNGVKLQEDESKAVAQQSGHPFISNHAVHISNVYDVQGDVDYSRGNIQFDGTVLVRGNILSGFKVKATVSVEVNGNVDGGTIEAGKNVRIRGGLYGKSGGKVSAGGDVHVRSVENGHIESSGSIYIYQNARHSKMMASLSIFAVEERGGIAGGGCIAGKSIEVHDLGSLAFTPTLAQIGISPKIKTVHENVKSSLEEYRIQQEKFVANLKKLAVLKKQGKLPADKEELVQKLGVALQQINRSIEVESSKLEFLEQKMHNAKTGRIRVSGTAWPKVKIRTPLGMREIIDPLRNCSFAEEDGKVALKQF